MSLDLHMAAIVRQQSKKGFLTNPRTVKQNAEADVSRFNDVSS